jgi:hypothetical protein
LSKRKVATCPGIRTRRRSLASHSARSKFLMPFILHQLVGHHLLLVLFLFLNIHPDYQQDPTLLTSMLLSPVIRAPVSMSAEYRWSKGCCAMLVSTDSTSQPGGITS